MTMRAVLQLLALVLTTSTFLSTNGFVITVPRPQKQIPLTPLSAGKSSGNDIEKITYHKGGNAHYTKPMVEPAAYTEECEEILVDFVTGDELCWNEAPIHPRNVVEKMASKTPDYSHHIDFDVFDDYHKGGNAHYKASKNPTKLSANSDYEEDCETPFIDFATGDELCWNDYEKSTP